jgi:hypothetical protein
MGELNGHAIASMDSVLEEVCRVGQTNRKLHGPKNKPFRCG